MGPNVVTYTKLAEDVVVGLRRIRIPSHSALDDAEPQTPDIALDAVCSSTWVRTRLRNAPAGDPLGRHVALAADIRLGDTSDQVPADAEIADLDLSSAIDKDIRRLDISMDDIMLVLQRLQAHDRR